MKFTFDSFTSPRQLAQDSHEDAHVIAVIKAAELLAKKYAPDYLKLVRLAADLHDIGLVKDREHHETIGAEMVATSREYANVRSHLTKEELAIVVEAIREHRASTGNPQHIVAKIVSDADRVGTSTPKFPLRRMMLYRIEQGQDPGDDGMFLAAAKHTVEKYGPPDGYGLRTYFPETKAFLTAMYKPVFAVFARKDIKTLRKLAGPIPKTVFHLSLD